MRRINKAPPPTMYMCACMHACMCVCVCVCFFLSISLCLCMCVCILLLETLLFAGVSNYVLSRVRVATRRGERNPAAIPM